MYAVIDQALVTCVNAPAFGARAETTPCIGIGVDVEAGGAFLVQRATAFQLVRAYAAQRGMVAGDLFDGKSGFSLVEQTCFLNRTFFNTGCQQWR